ncbi:MAG: hypothetical protein KGI54_10415 [Pseudomonadota bacterium]|nr:hypothetical protein [Pseudomonadota bacterium]
MSKFYGWCPKDIWALTWTEIMWWNDQAERMIKHGE